MKNKHRAVEKNPDHRESGYYEKSFVYFFAGAAFAGAAAAAAGAAAPGAGAAPGVVAAGFSVDSSWRNSLVVTTDAIGILGELRIS